MTLPKSIHQVRENRAAIQDVLDREWYPAAKAPSKSDFEIWSAMLLLHLTDVESDEGDVSKYLLELAVDELGLSASPRVRERCKEVARSLYGMRGQFFEH